MLIVSVAPLLFAGPVGAPAAGIERFVVYYSCATGSPQYTGFEQWDCEGDRYTGGTISSNRATVTDEECGFGVIGFTYWCKTPSGAWRTSSQAEFNSCHVCADIE